MLEANLIEQLAKKDRIIALKDEEIAVWEQLVDSYKRTEVKMQAVIDAQDNLLRHLQKLDMLKSNAIEYIKAQLPMFRFGL